MPDHDGLLTPEDRKKVDAWFAKYRETARFNCPVCGAADWMLAERLVQPITLGMGMMLELGGVAGYPQIMLISACGYTRFANAVMVGVLESNVPDGS